MNSLILTQSGKTAWIATATTFTGAQQPTKNIEVFKWTANSPQLLDQGLGIAPTSLKLSGSALSWTNSAQQKTAPF
ncbi:MAG: hypothetical protein H0V29_14045 [Thermoleophilaceae bacterium]|nr:hypothetical protein [Thermoleophilaceae bacterium]